MENLHRSQNVNSVLKSACLGDVDSDDSQNVSQEGKFRKKVFLTSTSLLFCIKCLAQNIIDEY